MSDRADMILGLIRDDQLTNATSEIEAMETDLFQHAAESARLRCELANRDAYAVEIERTIGIVIAWLEGNADPANPDDRDNWVLPAVRILRAALAKNPNPAGTFPPEASPTAAASSEASGSVGLGPHREPLTERLYAGVDTQTGLPYDTTLDRWLAHLPPEWEGRFSLDDLNGLYLALIEALALGPCEEALAPRQVAATIDTTNVTDADCADLAACIEREYVKKVIREVYAMMRASGFAAPFKAAFESAIDELSFRLLAAWGDPNPYALGDENNSAAAPMPSTVAFDANAIEAVAQEIEDDYAGCAWRLRQMLVEPKA